MYKILFLVARNIPRRSSGFEPNEDAVGIPVLILPLSDNKVLKNQSVAVASTEAEGSSSRPLDSVTSSKEFVTETDSPLDLTSNKSGSPVVPQNTPQSSQFLVNTTKECSCQPVISSDVASSVSSSPPPLYEPISPPACTSAEVTVCSDTVPIAITSTQPTAFSTNTSNLMNGFSWGNNQQQLYTPGAAAIYTCTRSCPCPCASSSSVERNLHSSAYENQRLTAVRDHMDPLTGNFWPVTYSSVVGSGMNGLGGQQDQLVTKAYPIPPPVKRERPCWEPLADLQRTSTFEFMCHQGAVYDEDQGFCLPTFTHEALLSYGKSPSAAAYENVVSNANGQFVPFPGMIEQRMVPAVLDLSCGYASNRNRLQEVHVWNIGVLQAAKIHGQIHPATADNLIGSECLRHYRNVHVLNGLWPFMLDHGYYQDVTQPPQIKRELRRTIAAQQHVRWADLQM